MKKIKTCDRCGKKFNPVVESEKFNSAYWEYSFDNFTECLCSDCAIEAIENEEECYYEVCEECGERYNPFTVSAEFNFKRPDWCLDGYFEYTDGSLLCSECAYILWQNAQESNEDQNSEEMSIEECAQIWLANGKDEDYMFGYTEEELEEALGNL